ncbi:MXAN_6640 family putative metalloprotease, partial [Nocardioides sp.]|uniref:MXAN_6640 family putative metalloprotease n=1 Tax=Nocardioides sp. TaxID=35761 RepID=UPI002ED63FD8
AAQAAPDATMALRDLALAMEELPPADQERARAFFARPTDPGGDDLDEDVIVEYLDGEGAPLCGDVICVHYANGPDSDAPPSTDDDDNGYPDVVDATLATAESVHNTYRQAGYRRPDPDGMQGDDTDKIDVYLADTGEFGGLYGYCAADDWSDDPPKNRAAFCVIDEDFDADQFPSHTSSENRQVTLAHEYFHAVQFAYDFREDRWIMEATATWAEEQLYDAVDDNHQYLTDSQISTPWAPLDAYADFHHYGNWVFFEYLSQRWRTRQGPMPKIVLDVWKRMSGRPGAPDQYSTQAIQHVLNQRNSSFTTVYGRFADGNRRPAKTYDEGGASAYRPVRPLQTRTLSRTKRSTPRWFLDLDHLTSDVVRLTPARGLKRRDWKLRVKVDMPPAKSAPVARVAVYLKSGKVQSSAVKFKKRGFSSKVVGFSTRNVKYVELVVANASRRSRCGRGTVFACQGLPLDDQRRFRFNASIFRS